MSGQQANSIPPAPIPPPLITAKTLFIANGGEERLPSAYGDSYIGGPDRAYNELYAKMKKLGRFHLVGSPSDADLVVEISVTSTVVTISGTPRIDYGLRAVMIETRTHIAMWVLRADVEPASRQSGRDQNFDKAMENIVAQIKGLTGTP